MPLAAGSLAAHFTGGRDTSSFSPPCPPPRFAREIYQSAFDGAGEWKRSLVVRVHDRGAEAPIRTAFVLADTFDLHEALDPEVYRFRFGARALADVARSTWVCIMPANLRQ